MSRVIGYVKSFENGTFFVKDLKGKIHQLKAGDAIHNGELVYGAPNNSKNAKIIIDVTVDGAGDMVISGNAALVFDTSLLKGVFSHDDAVVYVNSVNDALAVKHLAKPGVETASGDETAAGAVVASGEKSTDLFYDRTGAFGDVFTSLTDTSLANALTNETAVLQPLVLNIVDTIEPRAPTVALVFDSGTGNSDLITNNGALTIGNVENGASVEYSTDGGTTWISSFTPVEGSNTVSVRQMDTVGNTSDSSMITFILDTQVEAPTVVLTFDSGSSNSDLISNNGALTIGNVEYGAIVEYSTNGIDWSNSFAPVEGSNTVYVRQTDVAGNISGSSMITFIVDTAPYTINVVAPDNTNDNTPTITGTTNAPANSTITITVTDSAGAVQNLSATVQAGGTYSVTPAALADGAYSVAASVSDTAGNTATANDTGSVDTAAPTAPIVTITEDTNDNGNITNNELVGDVDVKITLPSDAKVGDTLNITSNIGGVQAVTNVAITQVMVDNGSYNMSYTPPAQGQSISVSVTITDIAGNISSPSSDSATMRTEVAALDDSTSVKESGLISGTTSGDGSNITTGNIFTNDSGNGIVLTQVNGTNVAGIQTIVTAYGELEINAATGDYTYTLKGATTDTAAVDEVDSISYTIADINGDTSSAKLNIIINDDVPILSDITTTIDIGAITTNLVIVLDKSGSMGDTAAGTTIDRLDLAKDAITQLINSYDGLGTVNVKLITFNDNAYEFSWNTATNTLNYINGSHQETTYWFGWPIGTTTVNNIVASGATDYDDPLRYLIDGYNNVNTIDADSLGGTNISEPTPTATNSYLYFFSDGEPNSTTYKSEITNYEATWKQFAQANFDEVYSIGMGSGVSKTYLDMISSSSNNTILVTDESTLASKVIDTVVVSGSGNILTSSSTSSATMLGADGGSLESFSHAGNTYTIANATVDSDSNGIMDTVVFITAHGAEAIVNFATGNYTYNVQNSDNSGVDFSDVFTIKILDGDGDYGNPSISTVTINVNFDATSTGISQNHAVTAVDDVTYATEDTVFTASIDLDKNDIDLDNDALSVTAGTFTTTQGGTIVIAADGSYTYTPAANFNGTDTVEYTVTDGKTTDIGILTINVLAVTDTFTDADESVSVLEDTTKTGTVLENTIDTNGLSLSVTAFSVGSQIGTVGSALVIANVGSLTINANGSYVFVPVANYSGTVPTATYTISNGESTDTSTLSISVTPVADAIPAGDVSVIIGPSLSYTMDFGNITIPSVSSYTFSPGGIVLSTGNPNYVFTDGNGLTLGIAPSGVNGDGRIDGSEAATFTFPVGMQQMSLVLKNASDDTVKISTDLNISNPLSISISGQISGTLTQVASGTNVTMNLVLTGSTGSITVPITIQSNGSWSISTSYSSATYGTFSKATLVTLMDGELFNNGGANNATVQFAVNTDMKNLSISQVPDGIYSANQNNGFQIDVVSVSPNYDGSVSYTYPIDIYAKIQDTVGTSEAFSSLKLSDFPNPSGSIISVVLSDGSYTEITANSSGEYDLSAYSTLLNSATSGTFVDKIYLVTSTSLDAGFIPTMSIGINDGGNIAYSIIGGTASSTLTGGDGNDYISGGAGDDTLNGGAGDDILATDLTVVASISGDIGLGVIDGGTGIDTLILGTTNASINFNLLDSTNNPIKNIEIIDLGTGTAAGGNHALTNLSLQDVIDMTDSNHTLTIKGDSGDSVNIPTVSGNYTVNHTTDAAAGLDVYTFTGTATDPTVVLKIEQDVPHV